MGAYSGKTCKHHQEQRFCLTTSSYAFDKLAVIPKQEVLLYSDRTRPKKMSPSHENQNSIHLSSFSFYLWALQNWHIFMSWKLLSTYLHFFGPKVHFLRLFKALMGKIFNKPPPWYPHILINLWRFICVGLPIPKIWQILVGVLLEYFIKHKPLISWRVCSHHRHSLHRHPQLSMECSVKALTNKRR